jgi:hypothetical protein
LNAPQKFCALQILFVAPATSLHSERLNASLQSSEDLNQSKVSSPLPYLLSCSTELETLNAGFGWGADSDENGSDGLVRFASRWSSIASCRNTDMGFQPYPHLARHPSGTRFTYCAFFLQDFPRDTEQMHLDSIGVCDDATTNIVAAAGDIDEGGTDQTARN